MRAVASRSDLTLVCSPVEQALLHSVYQIPAFKLGLAPFFVPSPAQQTCSFSQRAHFMTIGNWRHPPNRDAVQWLCQDIWPRVRQQLPEAELHVYGAYFTSAAQHFHKPVRHSALGVPSILRLCAADQVLHSIHVECQ